MLLVKHEAASDAKQHAPCSILKLCFCGRLESSALLHTPLDKIVQSIEMMPKAIQVG